MKHMNIFRTFSASAAVTVMFSTAVMAAAPAALDGILPCDGSTMPGSVVRPIPDEKFTALHRAVIERYTKLPPEQRKEIDEKLNPMFLMEYNANLWPDKKEYEKYAEAWKKVKLVSMAAVRMGMKSTDGGKTYSVLSGTRVTDSSSMPLTIGALRYNAEKNTWTSNNGELTGGEWNADERFIFGAQTGSEWKMTRKDSLSELTEMVRVSKTTNGRMVFVVYNLSEKSVISGSPIANHGYVLCFPITTTSAHISRPGRK